MKTFIIKNLKGFLRLTKTTLFTLLLPIAVLLPPRWLPDDFNNDVKNDLYMESIGALAVKNYNAAIESYLTLLDIEKSSYDRGRILYQIALIYKYKGEFFNAAKYYQRALDLIPDLPEPSLEMEGLEPLVLTIQTIPIRIDETNDKCDKNTYESLQTGVAAIDNLIPEKPNKSGKDESQP